MADNQTKTTSSKGLNEKPAHILTPHNGGAVPNSKGKQSFPALKKHEQNEPRAGQRENEWETVGQTKNMLKRKKKLSASLTSVGDTVNQEKRTRIEGIQLHCRGRLGPKDKNTFEVAEAANSTAKVQRYTKQVTKIERPVIIGGVTTTNVLAVPTQRFKRKLQENMDVIQKLNALTEQLRLEVNELKSSLITERGAVRALRAQNDADNRKWKSEVKKLQHVLETAKKSNHGPSTANPHKKTGETDNPLAADGLINNEIQRLTNEIAVLKEVQKTKDEKTQLEEIKTKERNIGQLKKDLQTLQNLKQKQNDPPHPPPQQSKISTMKIKTNETSQKPKKPATNATKPNKNETDTDAEKQVTTNQAQVTTEITQLKNIELVNKTKNVHKSLEMRTTKSQTQTQKQTQTQIHTTKEMSQRHEQIITNDGTAWMTSTTSSKCRTLPQDVDAAMCVLFNKTTTTTTPPETNQTHEVHEFRPKDNNSDTDSALSSAPPSISPQPPSTGSDSGVVIWQTMHSYSKELEKLQKELEHYHKENERLKTEMQLMKQELLAAEKAALAANSNNAHMNELLERISALEEQELQLTAEANELREQNELLEFRILEAEDDKMEGSCEALCQRLQGLLQRTVLDLDDSDKRCLQQLLHCVQQLDLDLHMDYMTEQHSLESAKSEPRLRIGATTTASNRQTTFGTHNRIVATVQPYNNSNNSNNSGSSNNSLSIGSYTPTPNDSPRKVRQPWQCTSFTESGVFVDCDFAGGDSPTPSILERSVAGTQTEETTIQLPSIDWERDPLASDIKRLQYYKERLALLEGKVLVYESSGEIQTKHLADRLQREIQLEKELKELISKVEYLKEQNSLLEEEKCEFEEAENDTRLRLQRLEVELEIIRQRNVELEFSKDALIAKYDDCRDECLLLREDLCAYEQQVLNLESDKQRVKQQLASVRSSLPLLLLCRLLAFAKSIQMGNEQSGPRAPAGYCAPACQGGNPTETPRSTVSGRSGENSSYMKSRQNTDGSDSCTIREIGYLKDEVKSLRCQIKELNSRHYEAMETADSHWLELEREYKEREEAYRTKEICLKQKINKLQDCLRDDARAAAEKIQQLEEAEQGLKNCLVRLTKEHRDLMGDHRSLVNQVESSTAQRELDAEEQRPLAEALENERRRSQALIDDLSFSKKLQQNTEEQLKQETDNLRQQVFDIKKDLMHLEVTNGELKEEVRTLEAKIREMEEQLKNSEERQSCLEDELRTKEELCQIMERKLGVCPEGFSLADELYDSPAKRAKREEIQDLQAASQGLGCALRDLERRELELPTHRDFQTIACSVKQLADTILYAQNPEVSDGCVCVSKKSGPDDFEIPPLVCEPSTSQPFERFNMKMENENMEPESPKNPKNSETSSRRSSISSSRKSRKSTGSAKSQRKSGSIRKSGSGPAPVRKNLKKKRKPTVIRSKGGGGGVSQANVATIGLALIQHGTSVGLDHKKRGGLLWRHNYGSGDGLHETADDQNEWDKPALRRRIRLIKRFNKRSLFRGRMRFTGAANKDGFYDAPDLADLETMELLRRSLSFSSFHSTTSLHPVRSASPTQSMHSQYAVTIEYEFSTLKTHAFVQTDLHLDIEDQCKVVPAAIQLCDTAMEALPQIVDCAVQVEVITVEQRILLLPARTRTFLNLLQGSVVQKDNFDCDAFRKRLLHLWETNEEFREHIELLQNLCVNLMGNAPAGYGFQESYDQFVAVLGCVQALKQAFHPCVSLMLFEIEEKINRRLKDYHNERIESEFCCTVYYPVERRNTLPLTKT